MELDEMIFVPWARLFVDMLICGEEGWVFVGCVVWHGSVGRFSDHELGLVYGCLCGVCL